MEEYCSFKKGLQIQEMKYYVHKAKCTVFVYLEIFSFPLCDGTLMKKSTPLW
jgi:hypothetical protein